MRVTALELFAVPPRWLLLKLRGAARSAGLDVAVGHVAVPTGPGAGVEIDEERVREAAREAWMWHSPVWRNDDGTVAEW